MFYVSLIMALEKECLVVSMNHCYNHSRIVYLKVTVKKKLTFENSHCADSIIEIGLSEYKLSFILTL
jgi:hypothetical protein